MDKNWYGLSKPRPIREKNRSNRKRLRGILNRPDTMVRWFIDTNGDKKPFHPDQVKFMYDMQEAQLNHFEKVMNDFNLRLAMIEDRLEHFEKINAMSILMGTKDT